MKTAIVTGASSGIGLALSKKLNQLGYKVIGLGRNFTKEPYHSELFYPMICDITNTFELTSLLHNIMKTEDIHILINNAGVGYFGPHEELNPKKLHEIVGTNLEAPLIITNILLRTLKKNKGYIINISSITAKKSNTYGCAYGATKAALTSFSNSLFDEVRKYGVKVISIHPDMTKSNFYRNADFIEGEDPESYLCSDEVAKTLEFILNQREGMVISELTLQPQKHQIRKKTQKRNQESSTTLL